MNKVRELIDAYKNGTEHFKGKIEHLWGGKFTFLADKMTESDLQLFDELAETFDVIKFSLSPYKLRHIDAKFIKYSPIFQIPIEFTLDLEQYFDGESFNKIKLLEKIRSCSITKQYFQLDKKVLKFFLKGMSKISKEIKEKELQHDAVGAAASIAEAMSQKLKNLYSK